MTALPLDLLRVCVGVSGPLETTDDGIYSALIRYVGDCGAGETENYSVNDHSYEFRHPTKLTSMIKPRQAICQKYNNKQPPPVETPYSPIHLFKVYQKRSTSSHKAEE